MYLKSVDSRLLKKQRETASVKTGGNGQEDQKLPLQGKTGFSRMSR